MMGKIAAVWGVAVFLTLLAPADSQAFRCGSGLVVIGDRTGKVLIECGPPTLKEGAGTATAAKTKQTKKTGSKATAAPVEPAKRPGSAGKVERWFYNCGEHDFLYVLTFEGGVLTKEETQGYGKGRSDCLGKR
jgi:hypothetical protein